MVRRSPRCVGFHCLTYARRQITHPQTVSLNQLVVNIEALIRGVIGEQIEVVTILSPVLAPCRSIQRDSKTATLNLVINSPDGMTGGGRITIETRNVTVDQQYAANNPEVTPGPYVLITVSDSGVGMTSAVLARAFDPFFTTKEVGKGSGLGLSQVYGFTKMAGGDVKIDSELGVGTTVKLYLPKSSDRPVTADIDTEGTSLEPGRQRRNDIGGGGRRGRSRCRIRESDEARLPGRDRSERHAGTRVPRGRPTSRRVAFGRDYAWRHEWRAARCRGARKEPSEAADQKPESDPPSESSRRSLRCFTVGRASGL